MKRLLWWLHFFEIFLIAFGVPLMAVLVCAVVYVPNEQYTASIITIVFASFIQAPVTKMAIPWLKHLFKDYD